MHWMSLDKTFVNNSAPWSHMSPPKCHQRDQPQQVQRDEQTCLASPKCAQRCHNKEWQQCRSIGSVVEMRTATPGASSPTQLANDKVKELCPQWSTPCKIKGGFTVVSIYLRPVVGITGNFDLLQVTQPVGRKKLGDGCNT
eukprot:4448403-Amphidinium_carterae.2